MKKILLFFILVFSFSVNSLVALGLGVVRDGTEITNDRDVNFNLDTISANWDDVSGAVKYWYAIGTSPKGTNVVGWTDNGLNTLVMVENLSLERGITYYVSVYAEDVNGVKSLIQSSNGQKTRKPYGAGIKGELPAQPLFKPQSKQKPTFTKMTLPSSIKNWQYLPPVGDQGSQNSCAGWAVGYYYKTYQEAKEHGWVSPDPAVDPEHIMSPAWVYNLANNGVDGGLNIGSGITAVGIHGCATWEEMPYNESNFTTWPSSSVWKNALRYRSGYAPMISLSSEEGINELKQHLANGNVAALDIYLYSQINNYPDTAGGANGINNNVVFKDYGGTIGGHKMAVIGYDDNKAYVDDSGPNQGAFLVINSWGTDWGITDSDMGTKGFMWIAYDYFINHCYYKNAWIKEEWENYQPDTYAIVGVSHTKRGELYIQVCQYEKEETFPPQEEDIIGLQSRNVISTDGGNYSIDQIIVADLTDREMDFSKNVWLRTRDKDDTLDTGEIYYFAVEKDGIVIATTDVPKNTVNNQYIYMNLFYDETSPSGDIIVNDGTGENVDYINNLNKLSANWNEITDPETEVVKYWYAIGTSTHTTNIVEWTDNGLNTFVTETSLTLTEDNTYYFLVKAENGVGVNSEIFSSDGQIVDITSPTISISIDKGTVLKTGSAVVTIDVFDKYSLEDLKEDYYIDSTGQKVDINVLRQDNRWTGEFYIESTANNGQSQFIVSIKDTAGNKGQIISGETFTIDTSVDKATGGTVSNSDGTKVYLSGNVLDVDTIITIENTDETLASIINSNNKLVRIISVDNTNLTRTFEATNKATSSKISSFSDFVRITIPYPDINNDGIVDNTNIEEEDLRPFFLNENTDEWEFIEPTNLDTTNNTLSFDTIHFSIYRLMALELPDSITDVISYPNPCYLNKNQKINFTNIPKEANCTMSIYTITGRLVRKIEEQDFRTINEVKTAIWDGKNDAGNKVASGIYIYCIKTSTSKKTGKIGVLK